MGLVTFLTQRSHKKPEAETKPCHQRPDLVSAGASLIPSSRTRAGSPRTPLGQASCPSVGFSMSVSFQHLPRLQLGRIFHSQTSTSGTFPQPFLLSCREYFITYPWISKVYMELDWSPGQFKEGIMPSITAQPDPYLFPASFWVHYVLLSSSSYDRFTE